MSERKAVTPKRARKKDPDKADRDVRHYARKLVEKEKRKRGPERKGPEPWEPGWLFAGIF